MLHKQIKRIFIVLSLLPIFFFSCNGCKKGNGEGEIVYNVSYPRQEKGNLMSNILPSEMKMKFKGNKTLLEFDIGLGMFRVAILADSKERTMTYMAKMMTKKYYLELDSIGIEQFQKDEKQDMKLVFTDDTKKIANYACKKVIACYNTHTKDTFHVYYTDKVSINEAHWNTPYKDIDGVLLDYQGSFNNMHMQFTAKEVVYKEIDDDEFKVPDGYKLVDMQTMKEFLPEF